MYAPNLPHTIPLLQYNLVIVVAIITIVEHFHYLSILKFDSSLSFDDEDLFQYLYPHCIIY